MDGIEGSVVGNKTNTSSNKKIKKSTTTSKQKIIKTNETISNSILLGQKVKLKPEAVKYCNNKNIPSNLKNLTLYARSSGTPGSKVLISTHKTGLILDFVKFEDLEIV